MQNFNTDANNSVLLKCLLNIIFSMLGYARLIYSYFQASNFAFELFVACIVYSTDYFVKILVLNPFSFI